MSEHHIRIPREWTSSQPPTTALDEAREAGRREVLRELAKMVENPSEVNGYDAVDSGCLFCGVHWTPRDTDEAVYATRPHHPDCLWLRAQQAAKEEG